MRRPLKCKDIMENGKIYQKIQPNVSMQVRYLHQVKKMKTQELLRRYPNYSRTSTYRHMAKPLDEECVDKRKNNIGRRKCILPKESISVVKDFGKVPRRPYRNIPLAVSLHLRYLHQDMEVSGKELVKKYRYYRPSSVYRHMVKAIADSDGDKRNENPGRPPLLSPRDKRNILNQLPKIRKEMEGQFTIQDVRTSAGISDKVSYMTISRVLYEKGYGYRNKRRKGILTENDMKIRLKFAKHAKKVLSNDIWSKEICFYLDGAGFTHKLNPCQNARRRCSMMWRKKSEGLSPYCTTAGSHEGCGGRVAKFMVSIAYGRGVTMCEEFKDKLNGESFGDFVRNYFPPCFENSGNPDGKLFLQDGDPSQNSALAMEALGEIGGKKCSIPPRSPDLNPIENLFNLTKRTLKADAIGNNITYEAYQQFVKRVTATMINTPIKVIDNIIGSMNKRIEMVIAKKGQRIKY